MRRVSKVSASVFVQVLMGACLQHPEATLSDFAALSAELGVEVSPQGIDERITAQAVLLLSGLFQASLTYFQGQTTIPNAVLQRFNGIYLSDSSQVALPEGMREHFVGCGGDGPSSAVKVQLRFNYLTGCLSAVELTDGCTPDQKCDLYVRLAEQGSLHIADLGYFVLSYLVALADKGAFFVSRLLTATTLYTSAGTAFDVLAVAQAMTASRAEYAVQLGHATRLPVRLIIERLPLPQVASRRRKAIATARKKGYTLSARHLALLEFSCYITNVPVDYLTAEQVVLLYALRWQIELLFKLCKSQAKLAHVGTYRAERLLCHLYARLIGVVLFHWLVAPHRFLNAREVSLPKAFSLFLTFLTRLLDALACGEPSLSAVLQRLYRTWSRLALKNRRRSRPSSFQRFHAASLA